MAMFARRLPVFHDLYKWISEAAYKPEIVFNVKRVEEHDLENATEKRSRTLKHLLKANHQSHAVLYHNLQFDNHTPHILIAAYLLGATADQLNDIYEVQIKELEDWQEAPSEITDADWQEHLGDKKYQRAFLDYFEDKLAYLTNYDWKELLDDILYEGERPMINCLIGGLGHPMIHLGYAFESQSRAVALEGLTLAATQHNYLHKYFDDKSYTRSYTYSSTSPIEILKKVEKDSRFDGLFKGEDSISMEDLFSDHEELVLEYWNAWTIAEPEKQLQESQQAAVALLVSTVQPGTHAYDFFMCHVLTTSHAMRTLLPVIRQRYQLSLVRQWWLLTLAVYITQRRPHIDDSVIGRPDLGGKHWKYVEDKAINGPWSKDAHYVKALRSMKEAAFTYGDVHEWFLAAAVRFSEDFAGWTGFYRHEA